jgi:hypothetical protein
MLLILFLLIIIGLMVIRHIKFDDYFGMNVSGVGVCSTIISAFIYFMILIGVTQNFYTKHIGYQENSVEIYSLNNDRNNIEGSFNIGLFLGSGGGDGEIKTVEYYQYFKNNNGGFIRGMVPTLKTVIYEDCDDKPYAKQFVPKYKRTYPKWIVPWNIKPTLYLKYGESTYELHVPKNTIISKNQYKIR